MKTQVTQKTARKGSYGLALVFALIAILGYIMMYSNPPHVDVPQSDRVVQSPDAEEEPLSANPYRGYLWRTFVVTLTFIIVLLLIARWTRHRSRTATSGPLGLQVVGRKYIGPRHYLLVVRMAEKNLLLGVTDHSINFIGSYTGEDVAATEGELPNGQQAPFRSIWQRFIKD
jgi:flagellar biogenesis protein FliO